MQTAATIPTQSAKPLVLSVDDEANIVRAIKRTLRRANVDVMTAESGAEALELVKAHEFDVIISDMRMPEMTGAVFLAEAAKLQPKTKRVLLTGYSDIESTIQAINEGGISTYLTKPWDDSKLIEVVSEAVKIKQLEARNTTLETLKAELEEALERISQSHSTIVSLLGNTIGIRDKVGSEFNEHKIALAHMMGKRLNMDDAALKDLNAAMTLHRIGRMSLPDALLTKPYVTMSAAEKAEHDQHPAYAEAVLMAMPDLEGASLLIRHQNEHWSGDGYPDQLSEADIPAGSAIIGIIRDYYDMRAGLYEETPLTPSDALAELNNLSGRRYQPELVELFMDCEAELAASEDDEEEVELSALTPGMVLARDLKTANGVLLLGRDNPLSRSLIDKIGKIFRATSATPIYVRKN